MRVNPVLVKLEYFSLFFRRAFEDAELLDDIVFQSFFVLRALDSDVVLDNFDCSSEIHVRFRSLPRVSHSAHQIEDSRRELIPPSTSERGSLLCSKRSQDLPD